MLPNMKRCVSFLLVLFFWMLPEATAQTVPTSFEQLQVLVRPGDTVHVTDFAGNVNKGKVTALTNSSLKLTVDGAPRDLTQADVFEIKQWRRDSLGNGALIGGGVAFGIGVAGLIIFCNEFNCGADEVAAGLLMYGAIGAGIGVCIDALIPTKQVVFQNRNRNSSLRIRFQPLIGRSHKGVLVSLSF